MFELGSYLLMCHGRWHYIFCVLRGVAALLVAFVFFSFLFFSFLFNQVSAYVRSHEVGECIH